MKNYFKLEDVADVKLSNVDKKVKTGEKEIRLCNYTDVYKNTYIDKNRAVNFMIASCNEKEFEKFLLKKGQVSITKDSEKANDIGVSTYIEEDFQDVVLGYHLALITPYKEKLDGKYLNYWFNTSQAKRYFENNVGGSGQRFTLPLDVILSTPLCLPNIEKQKKISSILFSLDKKIQLLHQINDNLSELAKTIYDYWFVQFDFPDEKGKPYKTSGGKMVYNDILKREIPEGWEVKSLGEIEPNIITGKTPPTKDENNFNGNILFITIDDIRQNLFIYNSERTLSEKGANTQRAKFLKKGDICVSCIGTVGVIGIVGKIAQTNQQINSISNPQNFNKYFLLNYLDRYFKDNFTAKKGAVLDNMNKAEFESIIIINPIQNIKEIYYGKVKFLYKKIDTNIQQIQHLQSLRDWLLPMLMNGQISVE